MANENEKVEQAEPDEDVNDVYRPIRHLRGCPEQRLEAYIAERPEGDRLGIVRCIDCGESEVVTEEAVLEERERLRRSAKAARSGSRG